MKLEVCSQRCEHDESYTVKRISTGWNMSPLSIDGDYDKRGHPCLFENLNHDSINYPQALGDYMEWLWEQS